MSCPSMTVVTLLVSTSIGTCILGLMVGVALGLMCGVKGIQIRMGKSTTPDSPVQNTVQQEDRAPIYEDIGLAAHAVATTPTYEEVGLESNIDVIQLSDNIAYNY